MIHSVTRLYIQLPVSTFSYPSLHSVTHLYVDLLIFFKPTALNLSLIKTYPLHHPRHSMAIVSNCLRAQQIAVYEPLAYLSSVVLDLKDFITSYTSYNSKSSCGHCYHYQCKYRHGAKSVHIWRAVVRVSSIAVRYLT